MRPHPSPTSSLDAKFGSPISDTPYEFKFKPENPTLGQPDFNRLTNNEPEAYPEIGLRDLYFGYEETLGQYLLRLAHNIFVVFLFATVIYCGLRMLWIMVRLLYIMIRVRGISIFNVPEAIAALFVALLAFAREAQQQIDNERRAMRN
ncbi:hypothetical protein BT63DRAFT_444681 [Microthyrium microscopicum]|uniref:Uncharacterized protein n=1 Tax=Microthyrium microscopicum TaxID=703497 RepID=A0A6A6TWM9_9PEZI|nr:hypothetical protein BT63DRAFT_444681 [Microthyrium microscopicum]